VRERLLWLAAFFLVSRASAEIAAIKTSEDMDNRDNIEQALLDYLTEENEPPTDRLVDNYWETTTTTVLVPVKIKYHHPTGVLQSFKLPDREAIEKALKEQAS
jgi:hypothetical protein